MFDDDTIFDEIEFVDFYRYVDVELAELYEFLEERAPWVRPADTGRSTNCLINVAGIQVHRSERGYHNYAEPYSWDVRLGHKTRDEALDELDDEIDELEVTGLLAEVGYEPKTNGVLTAWYQTVDGSDLEADELRSPPPSPDPRARRPLRLRPHRRDPAGGQRQGRRVDAPAADGGSTGTAPSGSNPRPRSRPGSPRSGPSCSASRWSA